MLLGDLLAHILGNALDAALRLQRNGFRQTVVVHQIPAEHGDRQRRRCLGSFNDQNNLVVLQFFGTIIIMTVLIMEPAALELNKILTCHNSATDPAQIPMAHLTVIYVILDAASVLMIASELPEPYVGWKCFVAKNKFAGQGTPSNAVLKEREHSSFKFTSNLIFAHLCPFASDPALDDHAFQNMVWLPDRFRSYLFFPFRLSFLTFGIRTGMTGPGIASTFVGVTACSGAGS
jgi:hypothetical protein